MFRSTALSTADAKVIDLNTADMNRDGKITVVDATYIQILIAQ